MQETKETKENKVRYFLLSVLLLLLISCGPTALPSVIIPPVVALQTGSVGFSVITGSKAMVPGGFVDVLIQFDANADPIGTAQVYLNFDPSVLRVVDDTGNPINTVVPGSLFAKNSWVVLQNNVDNVTGTIDFAGGKNIGTGVDATTKVRFARFRFEALAVAAGTNVSFSTIPPRQTKAISGFNDVTGNLIGATFTIKSIPVLIPINLAANIEEQITLWLIEPDGLNDFLIANKLDDSDPIWYRVKGEVEFYQLLLASNGSLLDSSKLTLRMLDAVQDITESYFGAVDHTYLVEGTTGSVITRGQLKNVFNNMLPVGGRAKLTSPLIKLGKIRGIGQGNTQWGLPNANEGTTNFTENQGDGDGDWYDELDEGFGTGRGSGSGPDDATTYWRSPNGPTNEAIRTALSSIEDPEGNTGHIYRMRGKKNGLCGRQIDVTIRLFEGSTEIASLLFVDPNSTNWQTRTDTLTVTEADSIGDYGNMKIETFVNSVGGGSPRQWFESAHEFEVPDAPAAPVTDPYGNIF